MAHITVKDAAEALGVSERTIYFWLNGEEIEGAYQTLTGKWVFTLGALDKLVDQKAKPRDGGRTRARFEQWIEKEGKKFIA